MPDILVVKVNALLRSKDMAALDRYIHESMKTGLVVLPPYCDAQVVPEGIKVKIENPINDKMKGEMNNGNS